MATPAVAVVESISTLWEALDPPDTPSERYNRVAEHELIARHRNFWWDFLIRAEVVGEGADHAQVRWELTANLLLAAEGRGAEGHVTIAANEVNLLLRAVERVTSWPAGVIEVITQRVDNLAQLDGDTPGQGSVLATIRIDTVVEETD